MPTLPKREWYHSQGEGQLSRKPEGNCLQLSPRLSWYCLLSAVVFVPLAVGVVPLVGVLLSPNAFVEPKLVVLCATLSLTLIAWVWTQFRDGTVYLGRALLPLAAFMVAAAVSATQGVDPRLAFFGDFEQGVGLLVFLVCGLFCFLTAQLVRSREQVAALASAVIYTATIAASIGLLQQLLGFDVLGIGTELSAEWIVQRGYGTIGNADTYAGYLVLPSLLALHRVRGAATAKDRLKWGGCLAALLASLAMTQTRGPMVGLVVGVVAYFALVRMAQRRQRARPAKGRPATANPSSTLATVIAIASVGAGVLAASVVATSSEIAERFSVESLVSLGGRIPLWVSAARITLAHPMFGIGPDSFRIGWYGVREVAHLAYGAGLVVTDPHNVPLLLSSTMGIVGLVAAGYLVAATLVTGFRAALASHASLGRLTDYDAWMAGAVALSVTLIASMLTSVLLFSLFVAFGVLIAPALSQRDTAKGGSGVTKTVVLLGTALGTVLIAFAVTSSIAHAVAIGARTEDTELARVRAERAVALAPWDSQLRNMRDDALVDSALQAVFTSQVDAPQIVEQTQDLLVTSINDEPRDFMHHYRLALLLLGSGQRLGAEYTKMGVVAGQRGLTLYPNSIELRTGVASGHLALDEPADALALVQDVWDKDPTYLPAGLAYVEAVASQGDLDAALRAGSTLEARFPDSPELEALIRRISPE